ncbi:MAG: HAD family hydrolase [Vicinamibacterales bacterium]
MIEAVFFDLDGTLFDRDVTVARILAWQASEFAVAIRPERSADFIQRVTTLDEHGHRDKREVYEVVAAEFGLDASVRDQLVRSFWAEYPRHCQPGAGVAATLRELQQRGKRLGIITNGVASVQDAAIDALGIRRTMDAILISETEGLRKPAPELFRRATGRVGVPVERCCFVGDHPTVDVAGAMAAGLQAFWKRTSYWSPSGPVPTIEAIPDLLRFIS